MKRNSNQTSDFQALREAIGGLQPGAAHQANKLPELDDIFAPLSHASALDPQRSLVIGNRGVGKSFWSSVLTHEKSREKVATYYPRLKLDRIRATLGFHEAAGKDSGPAPSTAVLSQLSNDGYEPEKIWRAVLFISLKDFIGVPLPTDLKRVIDWVHEDIQRSEAALRRADEYFARKKQLFLLVFDALDRLGKDWDGITRLTEGILRLALDMRGFRAMKAKIFIRTDQAKDDSIFRFADASKIRSDEVHLVWRRGELFGLLYSHLVKDTSVRGALFRVAGREYSRELVELLKNDEEVQEQFFYSLAGEFMGAGPKRGRTYSWLYDHLADTFGETSPRSFITAVQRAALFTPVPISSAVDHNGIRAGVQDASRVRLQQLKEDYYWIDAVMKALDGLEVPCDPSVFTERWKERGTIGELEANAQGETSRLPLELVTKKETPEEALLRALRYIGVVEFRTETRINMPDIFRVEAGIKRRGGVRPPSAKKN